MVYGPLAFGLLTGAFTTDTKFGGDDWRATGGDRTGYRGRRGWNVGMYAEEHFQRNVRLVGELKPIAERRGKKMPSARLEMGLVQPCGERSLGRHPQSPGGRR